MTPDQMNPKICPSALDEYGNNAFADTEGGGGHIWDDENDPKECNECGTAFDPIIHDLPEKTLYIALYNGVVTDVYGLPEGYTYKITDL